MRVNQILLHELVLELGLPDGQYAVFGDAALAAHDLMSVDEIALIVTPELFDELRGRGWTAVRSLEGEVLRLDNVSARNAAQLHHLSASDAISSADSVAGLPVVRLPLVRDYFAALGPSEAATLRLRLIDRELGTPRPGHRSAGGWAHLWGVLTAPSRTFLADRGRSFWGTAFVVACIGAFLSTLADAIHGAPDYVVLRAPLWAGIALLVQRFVTGVARRVCGGDPELSKPTASQAVIVTSVTAIPVGAVDLMAMPLLTVGLALAMLTANLWLIGLLYRAAFDCSVGRGVVGELVGVAAAMLVVVTAFLALATLLSGCSAAG